MIITDEAGSTVYYQDAWPVLFSPPAAFPLFDYVKLEAVGLKFSIFASADFWREAPTQMMQLFPRKSYAYVFLFKML